MSDFKERLLTEKGELDEKIEKLMIFQNSDVFERIHPFQISLLKIQLEAMITYSQCLAERITQLETMSDSDEKTK